MSKSIPLRAHEAAAYAAGRLTQLRRVVKPQPVDTASFVHYGTKSIVKEVASGQVFTTEQCIAALAKYYPRYGAPGDRLALREGTRMPLSAVRWHPVITAVRLERVQDASNTDFLALGMVDETASNTDDAWDQFYMRHEVPYRKQFDRDNPRTPWESNPWCWVIDVEGVKA